MQGFRAVVLLALLGLAACKRGNVDTTKDYYEDSEAPEYQDYILNGVETRIPWKDVPESRRYSITMSSDGLLTVKARVPIIKIVVLAHDKEGKPVDPREQEAWDGRYVEYTLNPKYELRGILGSRH